MSDQSSVTAIAIDDLDQPLFRSFPLWLFEEALRLRQLTFVPPGKWEDPYEDICRWVVMMDGRNNAAPHKQLSDYLARAVAQCWTFEPDSDVLLRAYSRVQIDPIAKRNTERSLESVRVKTSPRRLITTLESASKKLSNWRLYLGAVRYGETSKIQTYVAKKITELGASKCGQGESRADLLLLKRWAFRHEQEVRALAISDNVGASVDLLRIPFEPNDLFEEVQFDPRLVSFERMEREEWAKKLGYSNGFGTNYYYTKALFQLPMPSGWGDD